MAESSALSERSSEGRSNEGMGGLAKGLAIIEAMTVHGALSLSDAARSTNITRAAARRCLITLTELGYVEQSGREFRPTARMRPRWGGRRTDGRAERAAGRAAVETRSRRTGRVGIARRAR